MNEACWDRVKVSLLMSFKMAFLKKELSTSQKQAVIKLIEKKDRNKRFGELYLYLMLMLNWSQKYYQTEPKTLQNLISNNQNAYVTNGFISEGGRHFEYGRLSFKNRYSESLWL